MHRGSLRSLYAFLLVYNRITIMKRIIPYLMLAAILLAAGYWLGRQDNRSALPVIAADLNKQNYVCPMHPNVVQDHPGTCPICGMDLVQTGQSDAALQIHVDTATQQKFGVRLATAEVTHLTHDIHTYGTLAADLNRTRRITPTIMGTIVKLYATYPGQHIAAGSPLYEIYSEDLQNLQNEFVDYSRRREQTLKAVEETRARNLANMQTMSPEHKQQMMQQVEDQLESLALPTRRDGERLTAKLKLAGLTEDMLKKLSATHQAMETIAVRAQQDCTVIEVNARDRMTVSPATELMTCSEAGRGWLDVAFYPEDTDYIHEGEMLDIEFDDGSKMQTRLTGLSAITSNNARTIKAHIPLQIPPGSRLGDYADVTLHSSPRKVLTVPTSAIIRSGQEIYVMKSMTNGHFMPQPVTTGISGNDRTGIISGLEPGDKVAVNGQFLLDSAASIAAAAERYRHSN